MHTKKNIAKQLQNRKIPECIPGQNRGIHLKYHISLFQDGFKTKCEKIIYIK